MAQGGGVRRLDVRTLNSVTVEVVQSHASGFMTDGRGRVRIMAAGTVRGAARMAGSRLAYFYRTRTAAAGGRWGDYDTSDRRGPMLRWRSIRR